MRKFSYLFACVLALVTSASCDTRYTNPILPGWHSDPSCIFVSEWEDTFFCTTSTFLAFPGIPIYASKDLVNWKLVSHALSRPAQTPQLSNATGQSDGIFASTLRFRNGTFWLTTALVFTESNSNSDILIFTSTNPYEDASWSDPVIVETAPASGIDPDLFWDDDDQLYMTLAGSAGASFQSIIQSPVDTSTWTASSWESVWNGTGGTYPEGPHVYKKDGFYYLMIAEGGTETNHSVTIARSTSVAGPYESYSENPILTNRGTDEYFQTVGHADLFQDKKGNWWGVALATRSGPEWEIYPMGRETVLYPAEWEDGAWPTLQPVRGSMTGPLPKKTRNIAGTGPFADEGDDVKFKPGSELPKTFQTWRPQSDSLFTISPPGHASTLRITPSWANLTGNASFYPADSLSFISRIQSATLFNYSVDVQFEPRLEGEEAGISVFLTQKQHIDLGIKHLSTSDGTLSPHFVFKVEAYGLTGFDVPEPVISAVPDGWLKKPITLRVSTASDTSYVFSVALASKPREEKIIGQASAQIVSGGSGPFTGTLLGSYATSNGGIGNTPSYVSNWKYVPISQEIAEGVYVDA